MKKFSLMLVALVATFICVTVQAQYSDSDYFVTKWDTRLAEPNGTPDPSNAKIIMGTMDDNQDGYYVYYESEDGTVTGSFTTSDNYTEITFPAPGVYTVYLAGMTGYNSNGAGPIQYSPAMLEVKQWGTTVWTNLYNAFQDCKN